jgi:hypothetical protein
MRIPVQCVATSHGDPIAGERRQRWFESTERSCLRSCPRRTGPTQVHRQGDASVMASDLTTCDFGRTPGRALPTASCEKNPFADTPSRECTTNMRDASIACNQAIPDTDSGRRGVWRSRAQLMSSHRRRQHVVIRCSRFRRPVDRVTVPRSPGIQGLRTAARRSAQCRRAR